MSHEDKLDHQLIYILDDIKSDLESIHEKIDYHITESAKNAQRISSRDEEIHTLNKIVHTGNGQPSLTVQVGNLATNLAEFKASQQLQVAQIAVEVRNLSEAINNLRVIAGEKTPKEIHIERLKNWGKFIVLLGLVLPGFIALFAN